MWISQLLREPWLELIFNAVPDVNSTPATDQTCDCLKLSDGQIEDVALKLKVALSNKKPEKFKSKFNLCLTLLFLKKQMTGLNILIQPSIELDH